MMELSEDFIQLLIVVLPIQIISVVIGIFVADGIGCLFRLIERNQERQVREDLREDWTEEEIRTGQQAIKGDR